MRIRARFVVTNIIAVSLSVAFAAAVEAQATWTQWGGDNGRNFSVVDVKLSDTPQFEQLWQRDLGGGYSGILSEADRLYTMFRTGDDETVTCIDSTTGNEIWSHTYAAAIPEAADTDFGKGPNSTPLLVDDYLVTIGFIGNMHCLSKQSGDVIWKTSLWKDHEATPLQFGFSASPIHYEGKIIVPVGGEGRTLKAFNLEDGSVAWSSLDYDNSYCTPLLVSVDGIDQLVLSLTESVIGVSAKTGEELWSFPLKNQWDTHAFVPVWDERNNELFVSSFRQSHLLKLSREGDDIQAEPKWSIEKTGIGFTNAVRVGDVIYGTSGGTRSPLITAFDLKEGKVKWKERGFGISNMLAVGDRLMFLDEKGMAVVAAPNAESLNIVAEQKVLDSEKGWTFPTLVGNILFVRNQKQIAAWELK